MKQTQSYCILHQTDCIENTSIVFYEGQSLIGDGCLSFSEQGCENAFNYNLSEFHIHRTGEVNTDVHLYLDKLGEATVESEFGVLRFNTKIEKYFLQEDDWSIEYKILQEEDVILHTRIECKILKN